MWISLSLAPSPRLTAPSGRLELPARLWASSEATVVALEQGFGFLQTLMSKGLGAAWAQLQEALGDVQAQVLGGVQAWVEKTVLQQAILKLVALFNPAGAVLQALQFTYTTVTFFLDKGRQIGDVVETYLNALGPIAEGKIGVAANAVEGALGRTVPLVLTFLARLLGLGGVPTVLKAQLQKARVPIDKALDRLVAWLLKQGGKVIAVTKAGARQVVDSLRGWLGLRQRFAVGAETHTLFFEGPQLRMASAPVAYRFFLKTVPDTAPFEPGKKAAARMAQIIEDRVSQQDHQAKAREQARMAGHPYTGDTTDHTPTIEKGLEKLAVLTAELMLLHEQGTPGPVTVQEGLNPKLAPPTAAGFGQGAQLTYLNGATIAGLLSSSGTGTPGRGNPTYDALNQRRMAGSAAASYYVQGHLISEKLNGKGVWGNLTPLSREGNATHEQQVESALKKAATLKGGKAAFFYSVVPHYGRGQRTELLGQARQLRGSDGRALERILMAEAHVPLQLVCVVRELDPKTRLPLPGGLELKELVSNPVEQGSLADYEIGDKAPRVKLNLFTDPMQLVDLGFDLTDAETLIRLRRAGTVTFSTWAKVMDFPSHRDVQGSLKMSPTDWQAQVSHRKVTNELTLR